MNARFLSILSDRGTLSVPYPRQRQHASWGAVTTFGRDGDIRDFGALPGKVVLLVGDSGVGKSEILRVIQERESEAVAPLPVALRHVPGGLQRGLLEALSSALAELSQDQTMAERVGSLVVEATARVAEASMKDLARGRRETTFLVSFGPA